jgi:hypothetical protein
MLEDDTPALGAFKVLPSVVQPGAAIAMQGALPEEFLVAAPPGSCGSSDQTTKVRQAESESAIEHVFSCIESSCIHTGPKLCGPFRIALHSACRHRYACCSRIGCDCPLRASC